MKSLSVFPNTAKFTNFEWKRPDVSGTQGACHMIIIFFAFSLGNV